MSEFGVNRFEVPDVRAEARAMGSYLINKLLAGGTFDDAENPRQEAIAHVARHARAAPSAIRALVVPSRGSKRLSVDVWLGLRAFYLAWLRREYLALRAEIARAESLGTSDPAVSELLGQAQTLACRIKGLTQQRD